MDPGQEPRVGEHVESLLVEDCEHGVEEVPEEECDAEVAGVARRSTQKVKCGESAHKRLAAFRDMRPARRAGQRRECQGTHSCPFAPLSCCAVAEEAPTTDGEWFAPALATTSEPRREAVAPTLAHASELPSRCWARLMDAGTRRSGMTAAAAWACAAGEAARRTCARARPSVFMSGAMPEDIAFDLERSPLRRRRQQLASLRL